MSKRDYGVNIKNLVLLLGERLSGDPSIVIRELVSNASDASVMSMAGSGSDPARYRIEVFHEPPDQLVVRDYGRGMTDTEIEEHLAIIANSDKRKAALRLREQGKIDYATRIIGEFGLGFLSTFVIAERVIVETVPETSPEFQGWQWQSEGGTQWQLEPFQGQAPGTTVRMFLDTKRYGKFNASRYIRDLMKRFSRFITIPLLYGQGAQAEQINVDMAPWDASGPDALERWQQFLKSGDKFGDAAEWLSAIAINEGDVQGILYYPYYTTGQGPLGFVDIYSRGVLVEENNGELIAPQIRCVRGMIQSADLKLELSRSGIMLDDTFRQMQQMLKAKVLSHLTKLATQTDDVSRAQITRIMMAHGDTLIAGCVSVEDEETFRHLAEIFPLRTTHGLTTILDYLQRAKHSRPEQQQNRIYYFTKQVGSRQVAALVRKRQWELVDCSQEFHLMLLQRYARLRELEMRDVEGELDVLFDIVEPEGGWIEVINYYSNFVHPGFQLQPKLAHNQNSEMPLTMLPRTRSADEESRHGQAPQSGAPLPGKSFTLYVNKNNALMQRLVNQIENKVVDRDHLDLILHEEFHNIAHFSDELLDQAHFFEHHQKVLTELATLSEQHSRLLAQRDAIVPTRPADHPPGPTEPVEGDGTVFVGLPFKDPYLNELYEDGVKPIIEELDLVPIMLQETVTPGYISDEIAKSISRASASIFDITEMNPNVYYELGLSHGFNRRDQTILVCNEEVQGKLPIDISNYRVLSYSFNHRQFREFCEKLKRALKEVTRA